MRRRFKNILTRLLDGDWYYTNMSPRISYQEIETISREFDILLQVESIHGSEAGSPNAVYFLSDKEAVKAKKLLVK